MIAFNILHCVQCIFLQKMSGCNKMICTKCGCAFCWVCGTNLSSLTNPYDHFHNPANKECFGNLWLGERFDVDSDEEDVLEPEFIEAGDNIEMAIRALRDFDENM